MVREHRISDGIPADLEGDLPRSDQRVRASRKRCARLERAYFCLPRSKNTPGGKFAIDVWWELYRPIVMDRLQCSSLPWAFDMYILGRIGVLASKIPTADSGAVTKRIAKLVETQTRDLRLWLRHDTREGQVLDRIQRSCPHEWSRRLDGRQCRRCFKHQVCSSAGLPLQ